MQLEAFFITVLKNIGASHFRKMFGWICIFKDKNFWGGYKILDDNIIILFLVLSPKMFEKAIASASFQRFEFGKTWAEIELNHNQEINRIMPYLIDAYEYTKTRKDS